ncbi:MAG: S16 family serine protease [Acholeplasmataceae bacterium]
MYKYIVEHKKTLRWALIGYAFLIALLITPLNYQLTAPGHIKSVENQISIENTDEMPQIHTVYVITLPKVTLFQAWISRYFDYFTLLPMTSSTIQPKDQFDIGQLQEELSYQYAIINAYKEAAKIDQGITVDEKLKGYVVTYKSSDSTLRIGDLIQTIDGVSFESLPYEEWIKLVDGKLEVEVEVTRDGITKSMRIKRNLTTNRFGFSLEPYYEINTTPSYIKNYQNDFVGGPSGGLMQSIYIYCQLLNLDLDSLLIAGTGTISLNGMIGEIGGIKQKMWTVHQSKVVDVFYVGKENYTEALNTYNQLNNPSFELVEVGEFSEAISDLQKRLS